MAFFLDDELHFAGCGVAHPMQEDLLGAEPQPQDVPMCNVGIVLQHIRYLRGDVVYARGVQQMCVP